MHSQPHLHKLLALRSLLYTFINLFPSALAVLILPFIARALAPNEYAYFSLYAALITGLLICMEFSVVLRRTYVRQGKGTALNLVASCSALIYAALTLLLMLAYALFHSALTQNIPLPPFWIYLAIITGGLQALFTMQLQLWQIAQHAKDYAFYKMFFTLSNTAILLLCVFALDLGWRGMGIALTLATVLAVGFGMRNIFRLYDFNWHISRVQLKTVGKDILTLVPYRTAVALFTYSGAFLVIHACGAEEAGLYSFAFQVCIVVALFYDSVLAAIVPNLVASQDKAYAMSSVQKKRYIAGYIATVILICLLFALGVPPLITWLFPESYWPAAAYIGWMSLGRCLHGMCRLVQELYFFNASHFHSIGLISFLCALSYMFITQQLLQSQGSMGGALGLVIGYGLWLFALLAWGLFSKKQQA